MDVIDVLLVFARRKKIIVISAILFALIAAIYSAVTPRLYKSTATLMPPQQEQSGSALLNQLGALSAFAGATLGRTSTDLYLSILQTNIVAQEMVDRFHLTDAYGIHDRDGAAGLLRSRSKFTTGKDGLIQVVVQDKDPRRAAELAAGYAHELFAQNNRLAIGSASQRRMFFEQQLADEKGKLADAEVALKQTQQSTGVLQLSGQAANVLRQEAELQANITTHEVQLASLLASSTEQNPDVIRVRTELAGLRSQLTAMQKGETGQTLSQAQLPGAGLEYVRKEREVKYHETLFELLARQLEAARIDEAKASPTVQLLDPPQIAKQPSWPRPKLFILIGLVFGTIVGCCICVLLFLFDYVESDPRLSPRIALLKQQLHLRT